MVKRSSLKFVAAEPRLVITAILAGSRSRSRSLYRSPGTPIGKSIDYLDFATIKLPAPAYEKRLARVLLLMANFGKDGRAEPIIGKISHETLAEIVGTTRSRVSYFMNKFRKLGFIDYNGHLEVHNSLLNVVLYDTPQLRRED
jgi:hypothetical protein